MNAREWKRGDVAVIGMSGSRGIRAIWQGNQWATESQRYFSDFQVQPRPLVVIDPEDEEMVRKFAAWTADGDYADWRIDWVRNFLRSLITPPKPEEPQGLGAVVEDMDGKRWVRGWTADGLRPWYMHARGDGRDYTDIAAVKVLSGGVR